MSTEIKFPQHLSELGNSDLPFFVFRLSDFLPSSPLLLPGVLAKEELLLESLYLVVQPPDGVLRVPLVLAGPHPVQDDRQLGCQPPGVVCSLPHVSGGHEAPGGPLAQGPEEEADWERWARQHCWPLTDWLVVGCDAGAAWRWSWVWSVMSGVSASTKLLLTKCLI